MFAICVNSGKSLNSLQRQKKTCVMMVELRQLHFKHIKQNVTKLIHRCTKIRKRGDPYITRPFHGQNLAHLERIAAPTSNIMYPSPYCVSLLPLRLYCHVERMINPTTGTQRILSVWRRTVTAATTYEAHGWYKPTLQLWFETAMLMLFQTLMTQKGQWHMSSRT